MTSLVNHPERAEIAARLKTNIVLRSLKPRAFGELEKLLSIVDYRKGDVLISQGDHEMEQFFIIEGVLKRVVSNNLGKEMILRFAVEDDMGEAFSLQQGFFKDQAETLQRQASELGELSVSLAEESMKPVQETVTKSFTGLSKALAA